jgi:hypothetical protein
MLLRLIERKFGARAAEAHRARIAEADAETLLVWSERILTAGQVEEVEEGPSFRQGADRWRARQRTGSTRRRGSAARQRRQTPGSVGASQ